MVFEKIGKIRDSVYDFFSNANKGVKRVLKDATVWVISGLIVYALASHVNENERLKRENEQLRGEATKLIHAQTPQEAQDNKLEKILNGNNGSESNNPRRGSIENKTSGLKVFKGYEALRFQEYDGLIQKYVEQWNKEFSNVPGFKPLDPNIVKSMAIQESGAVRDKDGAWKYDVLQIANAGDSLKVQKHGLESSIPKEGYPELHNIKETPRRNGKWDYASVPEENRITAELSIEYGTRFLFQKGFKFDKSGKIIGMRSWEEAVARYNGGGTEGYAKQVYSRLEKPSQN